MFPKVFTFTEKFFVGFVELDNFFHGAKCFNDHDDDYQCDQIWTIFESSWQQFFSYKISEIFGNRWCYFETITFKLKCYCYFFGNFWNKLDYFYLIYGHTDDDQHEQGGRRRRGELFRKTFQQFHFKLKFWKKKLFCVPTKKKGKSVNLFEWWKSGRPY